MTKFCKYCKRDLPYSEYYFRPRTNILRYQCKQCTNKRNIEQSKKNRDKINARNLAKRHANPQKYRDYLRFNRLGISAEEYSFMKSMQANKCAICNNEERAVMNGRKKDLAVDHCHATGQIRNLLCRGCNIGLGVFKEDVVALQAAINYLKAHRRVA